LREHGDKTSPQTRASVEAALEQLRGALKSDDTAAIETAMSLVTSETHKLAEAMYATAGAHAGAAGGEEPHGGSEPDGTVDADFTVEDENK
jgi:molecular chaperone DnaK